MYLSEFIYKLMLAKNDIHITTDASKDIKDSISKIESFTGIKRGVVNDEYTIMFDGSQLTIDFKNKINEFSYDLDLKYLFKTMIKDSLRKNLKFLKEIDIICKKINIDSVINFDLESITSDEFIEDVYSILISCAWKINNKISIEKEDIIRLEINFSEDVEYLKIDVTPSIDYENLATKLKNYVRNELSKDDN